MDLPSELKEKVGKTHKMGILFSLCRRDSTGKQQVVAEQTSSGSKPLEVTQVLLKTHTGNSEWMVKWHEEKGKASLHERQVLPIPPDLCLICVI